MEWTKELEVGVTLIDEQHKELISRINMLVEAIKSHTCKYKIGDVIGFLDEYIHTHFSDEEKLMQECSYPGTEAHKAIHRGFIRDFDALKKKLRELEGGERPGSYELSMETNQVVVDWIIDHISKTDTLIGRFMKEKG